MITLDLNLIIGLGLLLLIASALLAVTVDRRFNRSLLTQIKASEKELQNSVESAPFGIFFLSAQHHCLYANALARQWLELQPGPLPIAVWSETLYQDLSSATPYRIITLNTSQTIRWWICPLAPFTLVLLADLTQQAKLEATTRTFLNDLSHELRTPLTAILAHIHLLRTPYLPESAQAQSLSILHTETSRITHLVQNLLSLSRLDLTANLQLKPLNIILIAEAALTELLPTFDAKQLEIELETDTALPLVLGDEERLKQVFINLLDNAIKFCNSGDKVTVELRHNHPGIRVVVHDTGPGIAPEHLPFVTKRLYQANPHSAGSGLGLALVEEILRRHQSSLRIQSPTIESQTGTAVEFILQETVSHA